MKNTLLILPLLFISACASTAAPNLIHGRYYMAGDKNCKRYRMIDEATIACLSGTGEYMENRSAMSDQELMMYMQNQQMQAQQFNSIMNNVNNGNRMLQQQNQNQMFYNYLNMPRY